MVATFLVSGEIVGDKLAKALESGACAAGKRVNGLDGAVECFKPSSDVLQKGKAREHLARVPGVEGRDARMCDEIFGQLRVETRAKMVQQSEAAVEDARGNNDVGVDGPKRDFEAAGQRATPALGFAAWVFVADQERSADLFEKGFELIGSAADDEADAARGRVFLARRANPVAENGSGAGWRWGSWE